MISRRAQLESLRRYFEPGSVVQFITRGHERRTEHAKSADFESLDVVSEQRELAPVHDRPGQFFQPSHHCSAGRECTERRRGRVRGDRRPYDSANAINEAESALTNQLENFSVDESSITFTGAGSSLPITLLSKANYSVTAVVHLITDRLSFPKGDDQVVTLDSSTKSLSIPTSNHRGSDLTLQIVVTTPNNQVVLARAAIQVRIAGNSIVGYLLTVASLLVLAFWWIRTYRRTSKGRHAR